MNSNNKTAVYGGKNIHQHCKMITVKSLSGNCLSIISSDTYRNIKKLKQKKTFRKITWRMLLIKDSQTTHNLNDSLEEYSHFIGIKKIINWLNGAHLLAYRMDLLFVHYPKSLNHTSALVDMSAQHEHWSMGSSLKLTQSMLT